MKEKKCNLLKFIIIIIMFFYGGTLIGNLFRGFGFNPDLFNYKDYAYLEALLELLFTLIIFILYYKYFIKDYAELGKSKKSFVNDILKYFVLFMALKIFSSIITTIVGYIIGIQIGESENQNTIILITEAAPIITLISTALLAPIVEEGIFRLALRKIISNKYLFVILSGLIFGFMHIFPTDLNTAVALTYSITYVTMGVYLAYIYVETDNIWYGIIIHALNNLLSMIAIIFMS